MKVSNVVAHLRGRGIFRCVLLVALMLAGSGPIRAASCASPPSRAEMSQILTAFETIATELMARHNVPGLSCAIVKDDEIIYAKGFGVREAGKTDRVDEHTVFEIGSTSKTFTAGLTAMLVDQGKLDWNGRVAAYLPSFRMMDPWVSRQILVQDLMSQRSGMPDNALDFMPLLGFDGSDVVKAIRHVEPVTSFRSSYAYQTNLFVLAGMLIEKATGLPWSENVDTRIFQPLGMHRSTTDRGELAAMENVATGHRTLGDGSPWPIPPDWTYADYLDALAAGGGIRSSASDMAQWIRLQLGGGAFEGKQLISPENLSYVHAPRTLVHSFASWLAESYCTGWIFTNLSPYPVIWHNGGTFGMRSVAAFVPGANIGLVVLTNSDGQDASLFVPEMLMLTFHDLYFGNPESAGAAKDLAIRTSDRPFRLSIPEDLSAAERRPPALPLDRYCGLYRNPAYGPVHVKLVDDSLQISLGPRKIRASLVPYGGNTFVFPMPDLPETYLPVRFRVGAEGRVNELVIDVLGDVRGGRFERVAESS